MRISDWSSDVCSSDLLAPGAEGHARFSHEEARQGALAGGGSFRPVAERAVVGRIGEQRLGDQLQAHVARMRQVQRLRIQRTQLVEDDRTEQRLRLRSGESRVGKGGVSKGKSRGTADDKKKKRKAKK